MLSLYVPRGHVVQCVVVPSMSSPYVPRGQAIHISVAVPILAAASVYCATRVPGIQVLHAFACNVCPSATLVSPYVPRGHVVHADNPPSEISPNVPAGHGLHISLCGPTRWSVAVVVVVVVYLVLDLVVLRRTVPCGHH